MFFSKNIFVLKSYFSVVFVLFALALPPPSPLKLDSELNLRNYLAFQSYWRVSQVVYQVNGTMYIHFYAKYICMPMYIHTCDCDGCWPKTSSKTFGKEDPRHPLDNVIQLQILYYLCLLRLNFQKECEVFRMLLQDLWKPCKAIKIVNMFALDIPSVLTAHVWTVQTAVVSWAHCRGTCLTCCVWTGPVAYAVNLTVCVVCMLRSCLGCTESVACIVASMCMNDKIQP